MRTIRRATCALMAGGALRSVDSMAASRPRWAATLSRSASIQVARASSRSTTRREVVGWRAERSVQPTAPPMAAPTGQWVTSPTMAARITAQAAAWRLAGSMRLVTDGRPVGRALDQMPEMTSARPTPMPAPKRTTTGVIVRTPGGGGPRSRSPTAGRAVPVAWRGGARPVHRPLVRRRSRSR